MKWIQNRGKRKTTTNECFDDRPAEETHGSVSVGNRVAHSPSAVRLGYVPPEKAPLPPSTNVDKVFWSAIAACTRCAGGSGAQCAAAAAATRCACEQRPGRRQVGWR